MKKISTYNFNADLIRTVAIIFVIIVHICAEYLVKGLPLHSFDWWTLNVIETATKVAVPLFIMLSGLLVLDPAKEYSLKSFYQRRLSRIGIPLLFWPFFYYLGVLLMKHIPFNFVTFLNDYIFLKMFYHLYFLYIILGLYFVSPFLKKILQHSTQTEKRILLIFLFIFSAITTVLVYALPNKINYWSIFTVFIPFIGYFMAGDILRNVSLSKKQLISYGLAFLVILAILSVCKYFSYSQQNSDLIRYFDDVLSVGVISMSLISYLIFLNITKYTEFLTRKRSLSIMKSVAAASFGIYIIHPLFLYLLTTKSLGAFPIWMILIIKVILIASISYVTVIIMKKIPMIRALLGS